MVKWVFIRDSSIWLSHRCFYINTSFSFHTGSWAVLVAETDTHSLPVPCWRNDFYFTVHHIQAGLRMHNQALTFCIFLLRGPESALFIQNSTFLSSPCIGYFLSHVLPRKAFSAPLRKYIPIEIERFYVMAFWSVILKQKYLCFCMGKKHSSRLGFTDVFVLQCRGKKEHTWTMHKFSY